MLSRPHGNSLLIEDRAGVMRMHAVDHERQHAGLMRGLANDVAADGITCNAILPSLTNTPATADVPVEAKQFVWQQQAIKRLAEPQDIVGPVAFLASEESSFITGQALVVDGGLYKIS